MNNLVEQIRKKQDEIILMVNSSFDEIIKEVSKMDHLPNKEPNEYELIYPLTNTAGFKGKKVIGVIIGEERKIAPTWKKVVEIILKKAIQDKKTEDKLANLCDKLLGRKRTRISSTDKDMKSPLKISENIYIETHYDTESLMKLLIQVLNEISYEYNNIKIVIKN